MTHGMCLLAMNKTPQLSASSAQRQAQPSSAGSGFAVIVRASIAGAALLLDAAGLLWEIAPPAIASCLSSYSFNVKLQRVAPKFKK